VRIRLPVAAQPSGMGRLRNLVSRCFEHKRAGRKCSRDVAALLDARQQVARVLLADEVTFHPLSLEGIGQGQAAHDVAATHE